MVADVNELQASLAAAAAVRASRRVWVLEIVGVEITDGEEVADEDGVIYDEKSDEKAEIGLK